jgi:hypothetical protein
MRPPHRGHFVYLTHFAHLAERLTQTNEIFMLKGVVGTDQRNGVSFDQQDGSAVGGFRGRT